MTVDILRAVVVFLLAAAAPAASFAQVISSEVSPVAGGVTLYRVFLKDGSAVVSYGEYARVGDEVVLSTPLGASAEQPRLLLVTLPAASVDWPRTDRYAAAVKYERYVAIQAESDFAALTASVASALNEIAVTTERSRALGIAVNARQMLLEWPAAHYGYREADIRDIASLIDEAINTLSPPAAGVPGAEFQLALVASTRVPTSTDPLRGMPSPREQVGRLVTLAAAADRAADRMNLLRAALELIDDPSSGIDPGEASELRRKLDGQLKEELAVDRRYAQLSQRIMVDARSAAATARVSAVAEVLDEVGREDARLGHSRPELIRALRTAVESQLDAARDLRLRRDQWLVRREIYKDYVKSVSAQVAQLVKARGALDAIRRLEGPSPKHVRSLQSRLNGGADRLQRMPVPEHLRSTHDLFVAAWRFAQSAASARQSAIVSGDMATAWQASSAAAGSLMLLARAQAELREALEPPKLRP
jgi:hypothetical protein